MSQLRALVGLRWRMVRSPRARLGLLALAGGFAVLLAAGVAVGQSLPPGRRLFDLVLLTPTLYVVFAVLTVIAPLVAGGGNELYPEGQLVAYPVEARTVFAGSLVMAPLNLAWITQLLVLVTATAAGAKRGAGVVLALATALAFVVMTTVTGQAVAWTVVGLRQRRNGRLITRSLGLVACMGVAAVLATGSSSNVLDHAPTRRVVISALAGSQGRTTQWSLTIVLLLGLTYAAGRAGGHACGWALRRSAPVGQPELAPVVRRAARRSPLAELVAIDRASVWRSTSLRRGALVLAVLPGAVAMLAHPTWVSLALLPGLVAAGAGLLFGVNAFCLEGGGAVFVASQPHEPGHTLLSKLIVTMQTCLAAVLLATALAVTQVHEGPTPAQAVAVLGSVLCSSLVVVAVCGRLSVQRPHKADLRGPRDTPAPPATMAVYSIRLALATTWAGLAFAGAAASGSLAAAAASCVGVGALAARSIAATLRAWREPDTRSRVVTTVAFG